MENQTKMAEAVTPRTTSPELVIDIDQMVTAVLTGKFKTVEQLEEEIVCVAHEHYISVQELYSAVWKAMYARMSTPVFQTLKERGIRRHRK